MNPILTALNQSQANGILGNLERVRQMYSQLQNIGNPTAFLQSAAKSDPALQSALNGSNGNYEQAFRSYAEAKGINADQIVNQLRGML